MKNVYLSSTGIFYVRKQSGKDRLCLGSFDNAFDAACVAIKLLRGDGEANNINPPYPAKQNTLENNNG